MKTREGQYPKTFINILLVALATGIFLGKHWGISTELYGIAWGAFIGLFISTLLLLYHSSNYTSLPIYRENYMRAMWSQICEVWQRWLVVLREKVL